MSEQPISRFHSVADTARWIAAYRAQETDRPDAIFRDPYARTFAGNAGVAMAGFSRPGRSAAWAMIVRTAVFDELIMREVTVGGCDCVLNLGAGLDTRPQRLALPPNLLWIEVDLPAMVAYKNESLAGVPSACRIERVAIDLSEEGPRTALFARVNAQCKRVLVVSEGLTVYLSEENVARLGRDLYACPNFALWLIDQASPAILDFMRRGYHKGLEAANAPMLFGPKNGLAFHAAQGWVPREVRDMIGEARRLKREMRGAAFLRALGILRARDPKYWSAMALLERKTG
ncbi:MAG TPA: SAM-dependent methyltransferase [Candidatus Eremiobacteraceae bacterium]|nr:SAM-dependent methyltransferase [Candidatus Eremiobacteraceae bacterium]